MSDEIMCCFNKIIKYLRCFKQADIESFLNFKILFNDILLHFTLSKL